MNYTHGVSWLIVSSFSNFWVNWHHVPSIMQFVTLTCCSWKVQYFWENMIHQGIVSLEHMLCLANPQSAWGLTLFQLWGLWQTCPCHCSGKQIIQARYVTPWCAVRPLKPMEHSSPLSQAYGEWLYSQCFFSVDLIKLGNSKSSVIFCSGSHWCLYASTALLLICLML